MRFLTGEFILEFRANGGTVVFLRSCWITTIVYGLAVLLREVTDTNAILWTLSFDSFRLAVNQTIPWIGAIFAGVYIALYARFASQWSYIASLYNQIIQTECDPNSSTKAIAVWWAAFIEDAEDLHLAFKPMFAAII